MEFEFLTPLKSEIIDFASNLSRKQLGYILVKNEINNFPKLDNIKLTIIGVLENRNDPKATSAVNISYIRKELYQLYPGNWSNEIADLGDIHQGETTEDTFYALRSITALLLKLDIIPIIIGGTQDLTYPLYRAFDYLEQMVNLVSIDNKFDFGKEHELNIDAYLSKIITDEPNNLYNFSNIGFQTYFNSQEEINLIEKLYFDAFRLGETSNNISITEPILRDADLVSVDLTSVKSSSSGNFITFASNGFDGKEICALSRYAGISNKVKIFGIFNHNNSRNEAVLISQIIWYFFEGYFLRSNESPYVDKNQFVKFNVPIDNYQIVFYKSNNTERWWMVIPFIDDLNNKIMRQTLLPCTNEDYLKCCAQEIPERWWKGQRKHVL